MKCLMCDKILSDREAIRKDDKGAFLDLCDDCLFDNEVDNELLCEENTMSEMFKDGEG